MPIGFTMFHLDCGINSAADVEFRPQAHEPWMGCARQVVEKAVAHVLVKVSLVAVRPEIQFERFEFDAQPIRNVLQRQGGEIRLSSLKEKCQDYCSHC